MDILGAQTGIEQARAHLFEGQPSKALQVLDRVSWTDLGWPEYWLVRTEAFIQMGDFRLASSTAKMGLEEDPQNLPLIVLYVKTLNALGQFEQAYKVLREGQSIEPDNFELQDLERGLKTKLKKLAKARQAEEKPQPAPERSPSNPHANRDEWKTLKDDRTNQLLFTPSDAESIKRAFRNQTPTPVPASPVKGPSDSKAALIMIALVGLALGATLLAVMVR